MSIKVLQEALADIKRDQFKDGDVLRWKSAGRYSYAAIRTPLGWYTTASSSGERFVPKIVQFAGLIDVLSQPSVSDIEFASEWTNIDQVITTHPGAHSAGTG